MPVTGTILDMLQKQANIGGINAETDLTRIRTMLGQQQAQANAQQLQMDTAYQQQLLKEQAATNARLNDPTTTSVRESEQSASDPNERMVRDLTVQRDEYRRKAQLAMQYKQDPKVFLEALNKTETDLRQAMKDSFGQKKEDAQRIANALRDVNSSETLRSALDHVRATYGKERADQIEARLPHDDMGNLLWNEASKNTISPLVSQYTSNADKAKSGHEQMLLEAKLREDNEKVRHDKAIESRQDQEIALRRNAQKDLAGYRERLLERTGGKQEYSMTKDSQRRLDSVAKDYKIEDYRKGSEVASRAASQLVDPKAGYESITSAQARTLVQQGNRMMDNYRSRSGGKYEDAQVARMNGMLQKVEKYVETIGEGDKLLAKDQMLQLAREMKTMYLDRNADLVKQELKIAETTGRQKGNPEWLTFQGNIEDLVQANRARKVMVDGKEYLAFGTKKEDIFPLPVAPERPELPLAAGLSAGGP